MYYFMLYLIILGILTFGGLVYYIVKLIREYKQEKEILEIERELRGIKIWE